MAVSYDVNMLAFTYFEVQRFAQQVQLSKDAVILLQYSTAT